MKRCRISVLLILLIFTTFIGCSSKNSNKDDSSFIPTPNDELICEETISPNKEYVTSGEDIVNYTIQIYQNTENDDIIVNADSNSGFFEKTQYVLDYDKPISKSDVNIEWTTLMGNPKYTEKDQLAVANVSISSNNDVFSKRKINFFSKGIEIVVDTINQSKK
ncbi:hypothetical protein [Clostridium paraputrificum]|uniref:hypothetical protein n=1 Tax=Clostridium paraputrificum TaxID=29363 RepID=UPI00189FFFBD|nr:hypothetical protein [Clostridium paraputrificum]